MMKKLVLLVSVLALTATDGFAIFKPGGALRGATVQRVAVSPFEPVLIYAAGSNILYKSTDAAKSFQKAAVFKDEEVRHIFFDTLLAGVCFVVTDRHVYRMDESLTQLHAAVGEDTFYTAAQHKGYLYIGTSQGLYAGMEDGAGWRRIDGVARGVTHCVSAGDDLYCVADGGLYRIADSGVTRSFVTRKSSHDEHDETYTEEGELGVGATVVYRDIVEPRRLWLGTNKGLFVSVDGAETWEKFFAAGIDGAHITHLEQTPLQKELLYVATAHGLFALQIQTGKTRQLFEGLWSPSIRWLAASSDGRLYAATDKGLFYDEYFNFDRGPACALGAYEPSIRDVQQAALRYNEVHPDKIRLWRQALKCRALFPDINVGYDKTIYGSSSGQFAVGPRDWGLSLSWDVGDLIWNAYEDDVDTRSRLNTQLRLDILDEINRVYFERLRLKQELGAASDDTVKNLRLQELTAVLDGYTGGYFSRTIEQLQEE